MPSINKPLSLALIIVLLLIVLFIFKTNISFGLNINTSYSNGKIYVKIETENNASCVLKKGTQIINLESQNGFVHEKVIDLGFFQEVNKVLIICYNKDNMFDFESAQIKINSSEINQILIKKNNNSNLPKRKSSLEWNTKIENMKPDEATNTRNILRRLSLIIFGLIVLITTLLLILQRHKKEINNKHINKRNSKQKRISLQQNQTDNASLFETLNEDKNGFNKQVLLPAKQSELLQPTNQTANKVNVSKNKIDYSIFSEFEQGSQKKDNINLQKTTNFKNEIQEQEIFKQTSTILKSNNPQDVLFLISEIIEHGFIKELIEYINSKNDVIVKNKLIDALYLLRNRNIISENKLSEFINLLTK